MRCHGFPLSLGIEEREFCLTFDPFLTGQLTLNLPPFLEVAHDEAARKATLSVQDASIAHQRSMWGMYNTPSLETVPCHGLPILVLFFFFF